MKNVPQEVLAALDATGLPYVFEPGGRHVKIKLANRLVSILPHGKPNSNGRRTILNVVSQIRRQGVLLNG